MESGNGTGDGIGTGTGMTRIGMTGIGEMASERVFWRSKGLSISRKVLWVLWESVLRESEKRKCGCMGIYLFR